MGPSRQFTWAEECEESSYVNYFIGSNTFGRETSQQLIQPHPKGPYRQLAESTKHMTAQVILTWGLILAEITETSKATLRVLHIIHNLKMLGADGFIYLGVQIRLLPSDLQLGLPASSQPHPSSVHKSLF